MISNYNAEMHYAWSHPAKVWVTLWVASSAIACVQDPSEASRHGSNVVGDTGISVTTIKYAHHPTGDLKLDIVRPNPQSNLHRAILLIHGGGWVGGNRKEMLEIGNYLADKGFLIASVDYRLAPKDPWPAQLEDVQAAVRYIRAHAKELDIVADEIGASGVSAGGHLSAFLGSVDQVGAVSSRVQAVCSISGIHDLNMPLTQAGETYRIVQRLIGETTKIDKPGRYKASPINFFDQHTAPTLFIQGKVDPLVPSTQTEEAEVKLKGLGVPTQAIYVDHMGHGIDPINAPEAKAIDALADWMRKYLRG